MTVDTRWRDAIWAAVAGRGDNLAELLRSDMPLHDGERDMLADLVSGRLRPPAGKRPRLSYAEQRRAAVEYIERMEAAPGQSDAILVELEARTGMKRPTILGWVDEMREVERMLLAMWPGEEPGDAKERQRRLALYRADMLRRSE